MSADLRALLDAGDGAVVTLVAGDTRLAAHRAVLAARSPVFEAMFHHDMLEASSGTVTMADVEGPVLRQLLAYLYDLQVPQLSGMAPQMLAVADKYGLSTLKAECEQQLAALLTVDNAAATAVLAVQHCCLGLRQATVAFMKAHLEVMATQGWADAVVNHPLAIVEISRLIVGPPTQTSDRGLADSRSTPVKRPYRDDDHAAVTATISGHTDSAFDTAASSMGVPGPSGSGPNPAKRPRSDGSQTPVTAALPTAPHQTPPHDNAAVSCMRRLSRNRRGMRLIKAVKDGRVYDLRMLLAAGALVNSTDRDGWTALHFAVNRGFLAAARKLLQGGAEVSARDRWQGTPLHLAAQSGHTAVVRLLAESSADPNESDAAGWTPLHYAALCGHTEVAKVLLEEGANREAADRERRTPLDIATQHSKQQLVQLLR